MMVARLDPGMFKSPQDAFTVALSVLTPETAAQCRALIEEAIFDQWPVQRLRDTAEAVLWPSLVAQDRRGECQ